MPTIRRTALVAVLLLGSSGAAAAQGIAPEAQQRLQRSLDASTYRAVSVVFDSAQARGLPVEPLVNRALQATLHRTPGSRVQAAVAKLADRLAIAKAALGAGSSDAEVAAGANALAVGVPSRTLAQIRDLSPGKPVTVPLGVLTELVARRMAVGAASQMIVALLRNGATPAQLVSLSDDVAHDVDAGIDPGAALDIRTRGILGTLERSVGDAETRLTMPGGPPPTGNRTGTTPTKVQRKP
jgi:hypothetical protein